MTNLLDDPAMPAVRRGRAALVGGLGAALGLVAAELLALLLPGRVSVVSAIADRVIEAMPAAPREVLVGAVGTLDKPLLVVGIVAVVIGGGALVGALCARRPDRATWWFAGAAVVAFLVAWNLSSADVVPLLLECAVAAVVAVLVWTRFGPQPVPASAPVGGEVDRRTVLRTTGVLGVVALLGVGAVVWARRSTTAAVDAVRTTLRLPAPTDPAPPVAAGATPAVDGLDPAVTPNSDFYRIDVAVTVPTLSTADWTLSIDGRVDSPLTLTWAQLLARPSIERDITLCCVSNPVGGPLVSTARWQGVRLTDLLDDARVHDDASLVLGRSSDGFSAGFPRELLRDGRDAMVAYAMNGEPLPLEHGFPARLVVPGLYGYVSATKWLTRISLTTIEDDTPFWVARQWQADGRIQSASRIDVPRDGDTVAPGKAVIAGRAWHQHRGVGSVQVSVDGGQWRDAALADSLGVDAWRLWSLPWDATDGPHQLRVRMLDTDGTPQNEDVHDVFPGASSGLHTIQVTVSG
ncbi:MAG TPA: molybdopterin-dependent oxidoreductase [Candidatus Nanopelagicales bacterium]|nr:molybdopterin-dependent oxidoreductase [Candidatus Nanopelagicales bacterium]